METSTENRSKKRSNRKPTPDQVPYMQQGFTFADREREIRTLISLLDERKAAAVNELRYVTQCNAAREYPGIAIVDPDHDPDQESTSESGQDHEQIQESENGES